MLFQYRMLLLSVAAIAVLPIPLLAQDDPASDGAEADRAESTLDDFHDQIVVTAAGLDRLDMLAGTSIMDGVDLQRNLDGQIGDVLESIPGVTASGFAPGASRPILRGFGGERVRVLTDGIGAIDASSTSDDHAVSVDPLIADRVEVLRGPAVLLYGSQAIGGAVNVLTKRIPPAVPDEPIHIDGLAAVDTASNKVEGGISIDVPAGASVAAHFDASYRNTDDIEIPGFAASDALRADLLADAAEEEEEGHLEEAGELREAANISSILPNSWTETYSIGTGLSAFSGENSFGVSVDYFDTSYGIPGLPGIGHVHGEEGDHGDEEELAVAEDAHGEEAVSIGMERLRFAMQGTLDLGDGFFDNLTTRWAYSDYTHTEFEGEETGTVFNVEGVEGRVELAQSRRGSWQGAVGAQFSSVDFAAIGEEAFVPANSTQNIAAFTLQEVDLEPVHLEFGARYERTDIDARESTGVDRGFDSLSAAVGISYAILENLLDDLQLGINLSRAQRAPSAQELLADGPHVATQIYEIGSADLGKETSLGIEAYVRGAIGGARVSASVYRNWFDGFIFLSETGDIEDGFEVFQFLQQDADQFGVEGEISLPLVNRDSFTLSADLGGEYVRATLQDGSPLPRIPPLSLTGALEAQFDHFDARAEVEWFDGQDRVSEHELPTDGFTFVNASLAWHPFEGEENFTLIAQVDNIFDVEGRRHASFTKEFVPLTGRNFKLSARASF